MLISLITFNAFLFLSLNPTQIVRCRRTEIRTKEMDPLLRRCNSYYLLCRHVGIWSSSSWRWNDSKWTFSFFLTSIKIYVWTRLDSLRHLRFKIRNSCFLWKKNFFLHTKASCWNRIVYTIHINRRIDSSSSSWKHFHETTVNNLKRRQNSYSPLKFPIRKTTQKHLNVNEFSYELTFNKSSCETIESDIMFYV